jgi:hypothetical protein
MFLRGSMLRGHKSDSQPRPKVGTTVGGMEQSTEHKIDSLRRPTPIRSRLSSSFIPSATHTRNAEACFLPVYDFFPRWNRTNRVPESQHISNWNKRGGRGGTRQDAAAA